MESLKQIENGILIVPSYLKRRVLFHHFSSVKVYSIWDFYKQYYFDYDKRAIVYLVKQYSFSYEVACMYLSLLYDIEGMTLSDSKITFLQQLKSDLDQHHLLFYNPLFASFLKNKKIYFYGYVEIDDFLARTVLQLKETNEVIFLNSFVSSHTTYPLYAFQNKEEEIHFVACSILDLYHQGVALSQIQITNVPSSYYFAMERIFSFYGIPLFIPSSSCLYATKMVKDFLRLLSPNISDTIASFLKLYSLSNPFYQEIYQKIINVLNQYAFVEDYTSIFDLLVCEFQRITLDGKRFLEQVEVVCLQEVDVQKTVFVMSFNEGVIPFTYKDEDYFADSLKEKMGLDTSVMKNKKERKRVITYLSSLKKGIFSYKLKEGKEQAYLSSLASDVCLEECSYHRLYIYSNLANQIELTRQLDLFYKYGEIGQDLACLYAHYPSIPYHSYCHTFTGIKREPLDHLGLSYSCLDAFYHCPFRYYVEFVLKLGSYTPSFEQWIGRFYHAILSKVGMDIVFEEEVEGYKKEHPYSFSYSELFFLQKLTLELQKLFHVVREQHEKIGLKQVLYEQEIVIQEEDFDFTGILDKVFYDDTNEGKVVALVDYKTGKSNLDLSFVQYGLNMQLPIYLYLLSFYFQKEDVHIAGFYLQKVLNTVLEKEKDPKVLSLLENYKLQGYSISNESILKQFDPTYEDSILIQSMKVSSKGFYHYSKVLREVEIEQLIQYVKQKIMDASLQILHSQFSIAPKHIAGELIGCQYCGYRDLCFRTASDYVYLELDRDLSFLEVE